MKCGIDGVTDFIEGEEWSKKWFSLSPYMFYIFIDDIIDYISKNNPHVQLNGTTIQRLLFAGDLVILSFIVNGCRKK